MEQDPKLTPKQPERAAEKTESETVELFQVYSLEELETRTELKRGRFNSSGGSCYAC